MFKKTRRKIVAVIMSVLVFLWVGTLGVIYTSSYAEMANRNEQMLKTHAQMYTLTQSFDEIAPPSTPFPGINHDFKPGFAESPMFQLSTFYTVAMTYEGDTIEIKNSQQNIRSDSELEALAKKVIKRSKANGTVNNLAYYKANKNGYMLVVFMDNTVINENAAMLFRYTLIFGGIALLAFFFLSQYLARKIVQPLEESYHKQKQFISDAGHELKTPVSVVNANADLLSREIGENQWLDNIMYENERMGILVGQLLELARTESIAPQTERINFSHLVQGEALPFESVAFEKGLTLVCDIEGGIELLGNNTQLKQLVSILLDNAICHSVNGKEVKLVLTREHNSARLSVINSGNEIPPEQRREIFSRFYRSDSARSGADNHYGLGLPIAKAIIDSHKGRIDVFCHDSLIEFTAIIPIKL